MIEKEIEIGKLKILGHRYNDKDNKDLLKLFNTWLSYRKAGLKFGQRANLPEALTESLVAKDIKNIYRKFKVIKSYKGAKTKFDCYNDKTKQVIEVKGCSIPKDLTSWSPNPYFDILYFVDFSSLDGKYKIYEINLSHTSRKFLIVKNKKGKTNEHLMRNNRRPRFSVYEEFINKKLGCTGNPIIKGNLNN